MVSIETLFLLALSITILIETCILLILLQFCRHDRVLSPMKVILTGCLCSFATLPYVWFVFPQFIHGTMAIIMSEAIVTLIEAGILWMFLGLGLWLSAVISLSCNVASYLLGPYILTTVVGLITSQPS